MTEFYCGSGRLVPLIMVFVCMGGAWLFLILPGNKSYHSPNGAAIRVCCMLAAIFFIGGALASRWICRA